MSTAIAVRDSSLLAMIERVATTPEMDLQKLERLIELQEIGRASCRERV